MATVNMSRSFNRALGRQVSPVTRATAEEIAGKARAILAGHRDTGASSIRVQHGAVDSQVILDDEASLSIEFGHGHVEGLHVLGRSI